MTHFEEWEAKAHAKGSDDILEYKKPQPPRRTIPSPAHLMIVGVIVLAIALPAAMSVDSQLSKILFILAACSATTCIVVGIVKDSS